MLHRKSNKTLIAFFLFAVITSVFFVCPVFAATTDVAGAVKSAYTSFIQPQAQDVVNSVVFPICDILLVVGMIIRAGMSGYSYKRNGNQFEWHLLAILFGGLVLLLSAPHWIWNIGK